MAPPRLALERAFGAASLEEHEPVEVDGASVAVTLRPEDADALAAGLPALADAGLAVLVRGGGSRLDLGNIPRKVHALLSTERLKGLDEFDPSEGVCHARAGTRLAEVRAAVEAEGWELPLDPPGAGSTVGGALASAALGPRCQGFGRPRDAVLGLEVVLATGERTRCGGRVVKNVTGYDMNKLYTGSLGTLGVIEGAWLRLRPRPERSVLLEAWLPQAEATCARVLTVARRATARVAAAMDTRDSKEVRLVVELAGPEPAVKRDSAWIRESFGAGEAAPEVLDELRGRQTKTPGGVGLRFRISALASGLDAARAELRGAGATLVVHPGLGIFYAGFSLAGDDETALARACGAASAAAGKAGGAYVLESAPAWAKRGRDVFGDHPDAARIAQALKSRFDPHGVLNPGRAQGHA